MFRKINWIKWAEILFATALLGAPLLASAAAFDFKMPGVGGNGWGPDVNTLPELFRWAINILLSLAGLIAVLFIILGGFRYITSAGNEEAAEAGRKTLTNAVIGLVIIGLSFVIVNVVINTLSSGGINP